MHNTFIKYFISGFVGTSIYTLLFMQESFDLSRVLFISLFIGIFAVIAQAIKKK